MVVLVFVKETGGPLTGLVKKIEQQLDSVDGKSAADRNLGAFVVFQNATADQLRELAQNESLQRVSLCRGAAPPRYQIHPDAAVTVVIYNPERPGKQAVRANFALRDGELNTLTTWAIAAELAKALGR